LDLLSQPYFAALKARLDLLGERQKLLSENIANASTPGYRPRDGDERAFNRAMESAVAQARPGSVGAAPVTLARTQAGHLPAGGGGTVKAMHVKDLETTLDGNGVVLEDQMLRAAETRMQYEMALSLFQKGLQLQRLASRAPGR
jgi:flagellar basal-body rod protein FlgB